MDTCCTFGSWIKGGSACGLECMLVCCVSGSMSVLYVFQTTQFWAGAEKFVVSIMKRAHAEGHVPYEMSFCLRAI